MEIIFSFVGGWDGKNICIIRYANITEQSDVLNIQRQSEVEEFYWELMGDDLHGDELFLVGSMVDRATVNKRKAVNIFWDS